jgi:hypothetical protein
MINNKTPLQYTKGFYQAFLFCLRYFQDVVARVSRHQGKWCKTMEITAGFDLYHTCINNGILYTILITGGP